jgi:ATP-dependent Clp protease adaptor protein ClpS
LSTQTEVVVDPDIEEMLDQITKKKETSKEEKLYKLILFNDDHHDMVEVSVQIIKAIKCTAEKAFQIMAVAHKTGQATVLVSSMDKVKKAGDILEEIDLAIDIIEA